MTIYSRVLAGAVAAACFAFGGVLASAHPLWPALVWLVFPVWCVTVAWRPGLWLFVVPTSLPLLNFSPWTGWLIFEEFDLLLLGVAAGGYGRWARDASKGNSGTSGLAAQQPALVKGVTGLLVLLGGFGLLGFYRGIVDAGGWSFGWFQGYADPLNSLRVFKSLLFALLVLPLLQREMRVSSRVATRWLACGVTVGLALVTLAAVWERAAFPGLLDFSSRYRTTALFWEMHVGGEAIDGFLAMATPFVAWALWSARRPVRWGASAALALLVGYVCLTTFSRGVYLAVAGPLVLLGLLLWVQKAADPSSQVVSRWSWQGWRPVGWRAKASVLLGLALVVEVVVVLGGGSFMMERISATDRDFGSRIAHWRQGLGVLHGPVDWWLGKGLGRLPAHYARSGPQGEFSGSVQFQEASGQGLAGESHLTVLGPTTRRELGGLYGVAQRVGMVSGAPYRVSLDARVLVGTDVSLKVCERHLLYERDCQAALVRIHPAKTSWQHVVVPLKGGAFTPSAWYAPRWAMFSLSVVNAGDAADFDNVSLTGPGRSELIANGDFSQGLARWFPVAQSYFLPWHIDNLYLELLIERGGVGVLLFSLLILYALWHLVLGAGRRLALAPYLAASLCGALLVGLFGSLMDVPRVAFLLFLLIFFSIQITPHSEQG